MNQGPFPPPALPGFHSTTGLSATPGRPYHLSQAFGWSSLTTPSGFPCCVRFPCVHAVATTPAQRLTALLCSSIQSCQPSPKGSSGRPVHCLFRGLLSVHSRYGLHTRAATEFYGPLSEGFSHFVTSIAAPVASGWSISPGGACTHWKSAAFARRTPRRDLRAVWGSKAGIQVEQSQRMVAQRQLLGRSGLFSCMEYPSARCF